MSTPPPPPPPPPEDPFQSNEGQNDPFAEMNDQQSVSNGAPSVAAKPGRMLVVLGFVAFVLAILFYLIFYSSDKSSDQKPPVAPVAPPTNDAPKIPPPIKAPPPPVFTPPTIPDAPKVDVIKPEDDSAAQKARLARLKSGLIVGGASGINNAVPEGDASTPPNGDPNSAFESAVVRSNTAAEKVKATRIGDLRRTIAQGRIIQATMESVINTELPAPIRAIVSRDTYAEAGTVPLIPKGSRLIGRYNTAVSSGQSRVFVVWTRVIRPDGVDVMINSPLVDQIGQAGVGGQVDSKFQEIFSRSVLASIVSIAFAIGEEKIQGGTTTTSSNASGTSTTGDAATTATINALNRLGATTDGYLQKLIGVTPTILVDQGTPVNVFVNRDLIFPAELVGTKVIE